MSDQTAAALQALIQQVTVLTEKIEETDKKYDAVFKMNSNLLNKVKGPKPADPPKDDMATLAHSMQQLADKLSKPVQDPVQHRKEGDPVTISRSDALDSKLYNAAKAKAAELGVPLAMIDDRPSAQAERPAAYTQRDVDTSLIDQVDDTGARVRYVRHDVAMGGAGLVQNSLAAERAGFRLVTFKDDSDLPQHVQTKLTLQASATAAQGGENAE